ncbi:short chain dehydrogenase, partial [Moniliophthora roreri]
TGSNTGIGYELVRLLASKGHTVYLSSRNEQSGQNAVKKLKEEHSLNVKYVRLDVTDEQSVTSAKDIIEEAEGKLDALVNNAGIVIFSSMPSQLDINQVNEILNTNYLGVIRVTTAFIPLIRKAGNGVILNVSSEVGSHTAQSQLAERFPPISVMYYGSRAILNSYTISLAKELKEEGIRVNAVSPGLTETRLSNFRGGRSATVGAEVLLPWVLLSPGEDKTGIFYGHRTNGNVEEIPW